MLAFILAGIYGTRKVRDGESYLLAGRKTGLFALVATLVMTEFNTSTLLGFSAAGYFGGLRALYLPLVFLIGLLFYTFTVAGKWKKLNGMSVAELFTLRYGPAVGKTASLFLMIALVGFSATYVKSMTLIFRDFFPGMDQWGVSFIVVLIILAMTLRGGLVSIIKIDILSFICTLIFIPLLFFYSYQNAEFSWDKLDIIFPKEYTVQALPFEFILSLILLTMFTYIAAPWYGQKIFSAVSVPVAITAVAISSVLVFLLYAFPVLAVSFLRVKGIELNPEAGVPYIIKFLFPKGLKGFAFTVLFAAGATTLSGVWSALTTMFMGDFLNLKSREEKSLLKSVLITLFFAVASWASANALVDKILNKLILANIPIAALSFALLAGFYWDRASRRGAIISIILGILWGSGCFLLIGDGGGYTYYWSVYGIPLIFASGAVFSYILPNTKEDLLRLENFKERMNQ